MYNLPDNSDDENESVIMKEKISNTYDSYNYGPRLEKRSDSEVAYLTKHPFERS